ncbi:MAG: glycosyltransferase [Acidimicrobiales bacterium]
MERVLFAARDLPPLRPDVSQDLDRYRQWQPSRQAERLAHAATDHLTPGPVTNLFLDVVMVVASPDPVSLDRCLRSIADQSVATWTLCLAVKGPLDAASDDVVARAVGTLPSCQRFDLPPTTETADAVGAAVARGRAPAWMHLGPHDLLAPDAIDLLLRALEDDTGGAGGGPTWDDSVRSGADAAYGDEDRMDEQGRVHDPVLKPGWSPELLLSLPYLGRPLVWRRTAVDSAGGIRALPDGDWEHDLMLRVTERTGRVAHVPEVLCHRPSGEPSIWSPVPIRTSTPAPISTASAASAASAPGSRAVTEALHRRGELGHVVPGHLAGAWNVLRHTGAFSASIIVPFRDGAPFLRACTDSIIATTGDVAPHIVLVDNGSVEPETHTLLDLLQARPDVTVLHDDRPFNWSALNNMAVDHARSDVLVFLNNDVVAQHVGWLEHMASHVHRPHVGAVGARLLYPTGRVQHAGVVLGMGGAAGHVLAGLDGAFPGYLGMTFLTRECSAVTGACLVTAREVFETLNGFDDTFGTDLNDVDFCLRAAQEGRRTVYEPLAELIHHESPTRGTSGNSEEIARFIDRWEHLITAGDDHLNPHLTRVDSSCALRSVDEVGWWWNWRSNLMRS